MRDAAGRGATLNDEILVAFGIDERFACHLAVTVTSIVRAAPGERFRFLVIHGGVSEEAKQKVESCAPQQRFEWHQVTDDRLLNLKGHGYVSQAAYYRLFLPQVATAGANRLIYLDCDIVVCRSLRDLWHTDLMGCAIGAVFDAGVNPIAFARRYKLPERRLGYFNSGVLLLDIARIRNEDLFAPVFDLLSHLDEEPRYYDQDLLNITFWDNWTRLNPMWNLQRKLLLRSEGPSFPEDSDLPEDRRPAIIHFTEELKPWRPGSYHPYMWAYFRLAKQTPYWDAILDTSRVSSIKLLKWRIKYALFRLFPSFAYQRHRSIASWRSIGAIEP